MPEQAPATGVQPVQPSRQPRPRKTTSGRRLMRIGCLPVTVMLTGCLLVFVNLVLVSTAPPGVANPDEYVLGQRIAGSLGLLAGLQVIGTWLLGLMGAGMSAAAASGQGRTLYQRLAIVRRRAAVAAWGVFLLRILLLGALGVSAALAYTHITAVRSFVEKDFHLKAIETVALTVSLSTVLIHWLAGPFLRLRYSMALGVWGATWARFRSRRVWMALTARMAAGMCGSLALFWGSALVSLIIATIRQPFDRFAVLDLREVFVPFLPPDSWEDILLLIGLSVVIALVMTGQLVLSPLYIRLARHRLAARPPARVPGSFVSFASQSRPKATTAPG